MQLNNLMVTGLHSPSIEEAAASGAAIERETGSFCQQARSGTGRKEGAAVPLVAVQ